MSEWNRVKDRLPPLEENIILFDGKEVFCGDLSEVHGERVTGVQACDGICYGWCEKQKVTHWMPLPPPPPKTEEL